MSGLCVFNCFGQQRSFMSQGNSLSVFNVCMEVVENKVNLENDQS